MRRKKENQMQHRILAGAALAIGALATSVTLAAMPAAASAAHGVPAQQATATVHRQAGVDPAYPLRCTVTGSNVNYRRGPSTHYASYGQVGRGFTFTSHGGIPDPRGRYFYYWDSMQRPGHSDAYISDQYVSCWMA
jgi:hypothetical protein